MRKPIHYYQRERLKGRVGSALLHLLIALVALVGLPSLISPPREEPAAITVELLPVTGITNVKPSESEAPPDKKPEEKQAAQPKPAPPVKTAEAAPPPPPPLPKKEEKPKEKTPEPKKEETKKEEKKKPKEEDLAAVLKAVKDTAQKAGKKEEKKESGAHAISNQPYNPALPMSMSEKDAIMSQIAKCFSIDPGTKDVKNLVPVINAEYNTDGMLIKAELSKESEARATSDTFFRSVAERAMRAVQECNSLKGLPPEKYSTWHYIELAFDPKAML